MAGPSSARIHPTAVVHENAMLGSDCEIGPFSIVGPNVVLGSGVHVKSHAVVTGRTKIGDATVIYPFACVGEIPQDRKYAGEETKLIVGKRNQIREGATLNLGTDGGGGITRVGNDCLFMTGSHVGHDCHVGNNVVMANQVALGGHCVVGDHVTIGGLSGIHQFVRIGAGAIIGAMTIVRRDVIPNGLVQGPSGELEGLNLVGLRRRKVEKTEIDTLRRAFRLFECSRGSLEEAIRSLQANGVKGTLVNELVEFIQASSGRSILMPTGRSSGNAST